MIIEINNGTVFFGALDVFENINFTVNENEKVALVGRNGSGKTTLLRVLTNEQETILVDEIVQNAGIHVICIVDEAKETEEYYKKAVTHALEKQKQEEGMFYRGTLRSGQVLETESSVVVIGDVNPGAQVISKGNIVILGCCMGSIYAGASGDGNCFAAALTMKPMQVRIADKAARSAIVKKVDTGEYPVEPKIIYIKEEHLQIKPITSEAISEYLG